MIVVPFRGHGEVETGFFLLDVFCLGVKDAGFHQFSNIADYQEGLVDRGRDQLCQGLGFSPCGDYKKASRVFGGITTADYDEQFIFGQNDKPLYIQGPSESPTRVERILRVLEARCGQGGYHYIVADDNFEPCDGDVAFFATSNGGRTQRAQPGFQPGGKAGLRLRRRQAVPDCSEGKAGRLTYGLKGPECAGDAVTAGSLGKIWRC